MPLRKTSEHANTLKVGMTSYLPLAEELDESSGQVNHSNYNVPGASLHIENINKKAMSE